MAAEALTVVLLVALLAFVLYPIFRAREERVLVSLNGRGSDVRQAIYGQIYELDFDYQMGKLTEEDYRQLRQQLVLEAARKLKEERQRHLEIDRLLDEEMARRGYTDKRCPACGAEVPQEARFCHLCGSKL